MKLKELTDIEDYLKNKQVFFKRGVVNRDFKIIALANIVYNVGFVSVERIREIPFPVRLLSMKINGIEANIYEHMSDAQLIKFVVDNFIPVHELVHAYNTRTNYGCFVKDKEPEQSVRDILIEFKKFHSGYTGRCFTDEHESEIVDIFLRGTFNLRDFKEKLHKDCDDYCFYHCSQAGTQFPECIGKNLLQECLIQLEYLSEKFGETGTGNNLISRLKSHLSQS